MSPTGHRLTVLLGDVSDVGEVWHRTAVGLLDAQGVQTLVPHGGREALHLLEDSTRGTGRRIHVAVLEQRMPQMTALQVLRRVHTLTEAGASAEASAPPAILLADDPGPVQSRLMHEALIARAFSVLPKPVDVDVLLETLARALSRFYAGRWPGGA